MDSVVLECSCTSTEHVAIIRLDEFGGEPQIFFSVHLSPKPWYKRLWCAVKYVLGYRCKYGDFEELILSKAESQKLLKVVCRYLKG